jgi:hypothetical protein
VRAQVVGGGVEEHHLADTRGGDLGMPAGHRLQVQIADRAAGEPAELQVDQEFRVGNDDAFAGDADEVQLGDAVR